MLGYLSFSLSPLENSSFIVANISYKEFLFTQTESLTLFKSTGCLEVFRRHPLGYISQKGGWQNFQRGKKS